MRVWPEFAITDHHKHAGGVTRDLVLNPISRLARDQGGGRAGTNDVPTVKKIALPDANE
jgi:hypothetical protein